MMIKRSIFLVSLLLFVKSKSYSQWDIIYYNSDIGCLKDMEFVTSDMGFFVGGNKFIGQTFNQGNTWAIDSTFDGSDFKIIEFIDADTGLICCSPYGGNGDILITYNGGISWDLPELDNEVAIVDMEFVSGGNVIYSELTGGVIAYTFISDNYYEENVWTTDVTPATSIWELEFTTPEIGFLTGDFTPIEPLNGTVFKTDNVGVSWYSSDEMYGPLYSIYFPSTEIGYGTGYEQRVWKTMDAGESWYMLPFDFGGYELYDNDLSIGGTYFYNDTIGYLEAHYNDSDKYAILRTINGGNTWYKTEMLAPDFNGISGFFCVSPDTCFAFSCYEIYRTFNGGAIDTVTSIHSVGGEFLFEISPNPATDYITLSISKNTPIEHVYSYNLYGQKVNVEFDATGFADISSLNPGVYFTVISTSAGAQVRKWVKK